MKLEAYSVTCDRCDGRRFIGDNLLCDRCNGVGRVVIMEDVKPGLSRANLRNIFIGCALMFGVLLWLAIRALQQ
jgi:hypothetical protein